MTFACSAVRLTGTRCGPRVHCRGASKPQRLQRRDRLADRGQNDDAHTRPGGGQQATPGDSRRSRSRKCAGDAMGLGILTPRDLGEDVRLAELGAETVSDVRQFHADMEQDRPDQHVRQESMDREEVPGKRVPVQHIEEPGGHLNECVETRIATLSRSIACLIDRIGGKRNWFG